MGEVQDYQPTTMIPKDGGDTRRRDASGVPKRSLDRGGGVYLPPAKRRLLEAQRSAADQEDPYGEQVQRKSWEDERKVIHGTVNRLNDQSIKPLLHDLFAKVNLVRMRGVLAKALLQATLVSAQRYGAVYAAALAVLHSKLPEVGDLVVQRTILHFRKSYQKKDKPGCLAMCLFLGHLFHQSVVHELLILQILSLLLQGDPTDDSVQIAIRLLRLTGFALKQESPAGVRAVLEQLRGLIHQGRLHPRVQQEAEGLLEERRKGFTSQISPELDLVEQDDQICLEISLDDEELNAEEELNRVQPDDNYEQTVKEWQSIRAEVLGLGGSDDDDDDDDGSEAETDDDSGDDDDDHDDDGEENASAEGAMVVAPDQKSDLVVVQDMTEADLIHLRRTIYLTIMSSATFEECTHKLAKIDIPAGREEELVNMLLECCAQERNFLRYYGLIGSRFCFLADRWKEAFMTAFAQQYNTIHRLETNKLRNVAKLLAHLLHTDALPWSVMSTIHLNGEETTSSSRIFLKILFQEIAEALGMQKLKERLDAPERTEWFAQLLPRDGNVRNTRYAINFFTSIGLGPLTDSMRAYLKDAPKILAAQQDKAAAEADESDGDESSSVSSGSSSSSSSVSSYASSSSSSSSSFSSSSSSYSRRRRRRRGSSLSSSSSSSSSMSSRDDDSRKPRGQRRRDSFSSEDTGSKGRSDKGEKKARSRRGRSGSPPREERDRSVSSRGKDQDRRGDAETKHSDGNTWERERRRSDMRRRRRSSSFSEDDDDDSRRGARGRPRKDGRNRSKSDEENFPSRNERHSRRSPSVSSASVDKKSTRRRRSHSGSPRGRPIEENSRGRRERSASVDSFGREKRR